MQTTEIETARGTSGALTVPDEAYWRAQIKCQAACPVQTDARGYVRAIAEGNDELAYLIARGPNPLASMCGRVCGAPCEDECRRGDLDDPVAIRKLKRFVCAQFGPEAHLGKEFSLVDFLKEAAVRHGPRLVEFKDELLIESSVLRTRVWESSAAARRVWPRRTTWRCWGSTSLSMRWSRFWPGCWLSGFPNIAFPAISFGRKWK